jgi:hypothetical protein
MAGPNDTVQNEDTLEGAGADTLQGGDDINWDEISDEQLLAMEAPQVSGVKSADKEEKSGDDTLEGGAKDENDDPPAGAAKAQGKGGEEGEDEGGKGGEKPAAKAEDTVKGGQDTQAGAEGADKDDKKPESKDPKAADDKDTPAPQSESDKAKAFDRLMAPFQANGRQVQARSVEDAISLMQMGANYNKKMAALKPNLRIVKLLEKNELLDEGKLSFLIDLSRKDAAAITKLVKESGLNPMDLDLDKAGDYKPGPHAVDEREMALDETLEAIESTPSYQRTLGIVKDWDQASKKLVADYPQLLQILNDNVQRGVYDLVTAEVERERMFGRLAGLSDLEAYRQIGDAMDKRGAFTNLGRPQEEQPGSKVVVPPKPKKDDDGKRDEKRRALAPTKPAAPSSGKTLEGINPLELSDEEFSKLSLNRFK